MAPYCCMIPSKVLVDGLELLAFGLEVYNIIAVSYTHLTLPTIYSV